MSDQPDRQEKIHDPTPTRLKKAREEGNLFRSKEMSSVGLLAVSAALLILGMPAAFGALQHLTARLFLGAPTMEFTTASVQGLVADIGWQVTLVLAPFFAALLVAGAGLSVAQTGWNVSVKPLVPKANRISPLQGFKRMFSSKGLFETAKSLVKIAVVGPLAFLAIRSHLPQILSLHTVPLEGIFTMAAGWIALLLVQMLAALAVLSAADFSFEKWKYKQDLKMTDRELKDEAKNQDGDPLLKGKRRQLAREMARRPRLDHAVMQADVVVTNPTHYAVALAYDPLTGSAPRVLAKGVRKRALRIKELAADLGTPTVEDRPLARALHATVDEGHEIAEDLYPAVAAVLAEVYRQRDATVGA
ncbi:MAG: EscU/YscU/HrcU family type III secretion system export apparatus switch protein [Bacteroidota bacterium]